MLLAFQIICWLVIGAFGGFVCANVLASICFVQVR
jgi:hypothetical protein